MGPVVGIVLAAGASQRMGQPKQLLAFGGDTFVGRAVRTLREGGAETVTVVVGAHAAAVMAAVPLGATVVSNPNWQDGQLSSARVGLRAALETGADRVLLSLVDHPALRPETVRTLLLTGAPCAAPSVDGAGGHPLLFCAEAARLVLRQETAVSLKEAIARARLVVTRVPTEDRGALSNINTREELETALASFADV